MKRILVFALGASLFIGACKKNDDDDNAQPKARVMFVHGALDADSLRGRVNTTNIRTIAFKTNSGYSSVDAANNATLDFVFPGSGSVFGATTQNLVANNSYSVFAGGSATMKITVATSDDLTAPPAGKAKVRLVHLGSGMGNAVFYVGGMTIDSNVAMGTVTAFKEVNAGTVNVTVAALPAVDALNPFTISAGKIYTFIFTGTSTGSGNSAPDLISITNN